MASERVLFGLLTPGLGGHSRTAIALAEVLRSRGHTIDFLVNASAGPAKTSLVRAAGFPVFPIAGVYGRPGHSLFRRNLNELVRQHSYDAIHWFEFYAGVRDAARVAADTRCAFVWTVTSGGVPAGYYGLNRVVVFTDEVASDVRRRSPGTVVHVLPARFDFRPLDHQFIDTARRDLRPRFDVTDRDLLIVRVARCSAVYLPSIRAGMALAASLTRAGRPAVFLHAGYAAEPKVAHEIRRLVDRANAMAGRRIAYSVTDDIQTGTRYAAAADICIGSGRTAIEAVALERPTLVAWGSRSLGMVDANNIEAVAQTNFQGRNSRKVESEEETVRQMHAAVCARLSEPDGGGRIHATCARFVREQYSLDTAADVYERLYADRTVTIDGFLKYYGNPRHLGRELFHWLPLDIRRSRTVGVVRRVRSWLGASRID